jgi:hypothetical protein
MSVRRTGAVVVALLAAVVLAACAAPTTPGTVGGGTTATPGGGPGGMMGGGSGGPGGTGGTTVTPGAGGMMGGAATRPRIEDLGNGRVVAWGWVTRVNLEGGFWAATTNPNMRGIQPKVVAVLLPGKVSEAEIARLEGSFVGAEGTLQTGASTRMAGPEVVVDAVRALLPGQ